MLPVSIRSLSPLLGELLKELLPENAFAQVIIHVYVQADNRTTLIDAHHWVIPAEAGPPLTTDDTLFPECPDSYFVASSHVAGDVVRLPLSVFSCLHLGGRGELE